MWSQKSIEQIQKERLQDYTIIIVSSAEPYVHSYTPKGIKVSRGSGGVVTAIEPVIKASKGIWIAHGRGSADIETVDGNQKINLPPRQPKYTLKRLFISKKDLQGWYYGFSNEMLYPLCLNVFERPKFSQTDWLAYEKINQQFVDAILLEAKDKKALVWIQDYQMARVAALLKQQRPDLLITHFWHIPWPDSNVFRICPWKKEIVEGLLGNDLLCFHINRFCLNFLHTVGKTLEAKIDLENMTVTYKDHVTYVKSFPGSIDYKAITNYSSRVKPRRSFVNKYINSTYQYLALGVERLDYVKGIPERIKAIDRFLEKYPEYQKKFTYVNVMTASRTLIKRYEDLANEIENLVIRVNFKYGTDHWTPINIVKEPLPSNEIYSLYKNADMVMVTSLADGMNLVAKEYIAAGPNDGVLLLSDQTGATKELSDAMIVNPYDIEGMADSIKAAIEMPTKEKKDRMEKMRAVVEKQNVYRWSGKLLNALLDLKR